MYKFMQSIYFHPKIGICLCSAFLYAFAYIYAIEYFYTIAFLYAIAYLYAFFLQQTWSLLIAVYSLTEREWPAQLEIFQGA